MATEGKTNASEEASLGDIETWTINVPFQHVFVKADAHETRLGPEVAVEFIKQEFDSLCRVEVCETPSDGTLNVTDVSAWQLVAPCPFCRPKEPMVLKSDNWVYVHDWTREEYDTTAMTRDEYVEEHAMDIKVLCDDVGTDRFLTGAFFSETMAKWCAGKLVPPGVALEDASGQNVYGLRLPELREALTEPVGQVRSSVAAAEKLVFGLDGYFGGLYRCPHCGAIFAVVYRDSCNPLRLGRYEMFSLYSETLDELMGIMPPHGPYNLMVPHVSGPAKDMSIDVEHIDGRIVLTTTIAGVPHQMEFNTETGTFLLDGSSFVIEHFFAQAFSDHPLVCSGLFGVPELVDCIKRLLPALPEEIEARFSAGRSYGNLLLLIAANRFVGYPPSFYDECATSGFPWDLYPLGCGLPREYADLSRLFQMTGLPDDAALKRALLERPEALHAVLERPDVPFWSVDVLCRFFELPDVERIMRFVNYRVHSCAGWRWLASLKGEEAVLDYLATQPRDVITNVSDLLSYMRHELPKLAAEGIGDVPIEEIERVLTCQKWQMRNPNRDLDESFVYDDFAEGLSFETGKFSFVLPRTPRDFLLASIELRSPLDVLMRRAPLLRERLTVIVREDGQAVAGIKVSQEGSIIMARAKDGDPIEEDTELHGAVEEWAKQKSLHRDDDIDDGMIKYQ